MRVMLSGKASLAMALEAVNADDLHRFLVKPWEEEELRVMIRTALRHREDQARVKELSRLLGRQAELFARIVHRHPDCGDLVERFFTEDRNPGVAEGAEDPVEEADRDRTLLPQ